MKKQLKQIKEHDYFFIVVDLEYNDSLGELN